MEVISQKKMMNALDWAYESAINGLPKMKSAEELADDYLDKSNTLESAIDKLIKWQVGKCTTSGFITGLGGVITLPVAIPANISSVIYIQIKMVAAIAYMNGYDIRNDKVKSLVYMCLCGNAAKDIAKQVGIKLGTKITEKMIKQIPGKVLTIINQKVGFRLITKFGQKGIVNLGKMIPVVGGVIGGGVDGASTATIGKVAKSTFYVK